MATIPVLTIHADVYGIPAALACFAIRMLGVRYGLNAPRPPGQSGESEQP